jgi:hypothetical protein
MRRRSDEEIQAFLDEGRSPAEARDWEREELLDLRAYALIDEALAEEPEFTLPPDFADQVADRLRPKPVVPAEKVIIAIVLAAYAVVGAITAIGSAPLVMAGAARVVAFLAVHGRPDIVLAITALLAGIALFDRVLSSLMGRSKASSPRSPLQPRGR